MTSRGRLGAAVLLAALVGAGCGDDPTSQVIVTIDADPEVKARARVIDVSIYGGVRAEDALPEEGPQQVPFSVVASDAWPVSVALAPKDGDANRLFRILATARDGSNETLAEVRAISGYVEGETLWLRLYFDAACLGVDPCDNPDETCAAGECVNARVDEKNLPPYTEGGSDAGVPADGGAGCSASEECDDGVSCTLDACDEGRCVYAPDDDACTDGPDGWCDPTGGCQYSVCNETTCVPEPCQTAECEAGTGRCVRTSLCASGETCCAGSCVAAGCDDGNPCTDDSCGAAGCLNENNAEVCDDGMFCNGVDTCNGGSCSTHAGDPCMGSSTCDESRGACVNCTGDADCPDDTVMPVGSCAYPSTCAESGEQAVSITSYSCVDAVCVESERSDTEPCSRDTDGATCGTPRDDPGTCGADCERTHTVTPRICAGGGCADGTPAVIVVSCSGGACVLDAGVPDGGLDAGSEDAGGFDAGGSCDTYETDCSDGIDNDCNGDTDCVDSYCVGDPVCVDAGGFGEGGSCDTYETDCSDGIDNDCNGDTDCMDSYCVGDPACWDAG